MTALFSLVVPTYNVGPYLDDFLASLAEQRYPVGDIDIVFVDDGSTDSSAEIISRWTATVAPSASLVRKANGGLSSARNAGLERATGTWVTFCDPDDTLAPDYFATVARFLTAHDEAGIDLVACRLLRFDERTGELSDTHPLRFRFAKGNRIVDLERQPRYIHLSAASGFYRTNRIAALGLRFDHRIRPNFEDAHFTGLYLAERRRPRVAFLRDAVYHYRWRADESSLVQGSWLRPEKLTEIPRYGHLDLLRRVQSARGAIPTWLQNLVLYDISYPFKYDEHVDSPLAGVEPRAARRFHELLPEILSHIDTATIDNYRVSVVSADIRSALIIGAKGERSRPDVIRLGRVDADQRLAELRYYFGGRTPAEEFRQRGTVIAPVHAKVRRVTYLGRHMLSERIVWLPADGPIEVVIDGRRTPVALGTDTAARLVVDPARRRRLASVVQASPYDDAPRPSRPPRERSSDDWYWALRRHGVRALRWWHRTAARLRGGTRNRRYRGAWLFIDDARSARGDAEQLYRFVRDQHPEINAWFVVARDTEEWRRLAGDGSRLVPYGTRDHQSLLLACTELISSRLDDDIIAPFDRRRFGNGRWRLTFVPNEVTTDDRSRSFNRAPISRFITTTPAEHQSIAGDGTPSVFTDKEVVLTGAPRHDRLVRLARGAVADLLLVVPAPLGSTLAQPWVDLLASDRLGELADRTGSRVALVLPESVTATFVGVRSVPDHVDVVGHGDDIQQFLARGAAMITDYSPLATELAYLGRPVIYFQFDRRRYLAHLRGYRPGTWSYEADGFGPVRQRVSDVLDEFERLVDGGMAPQEPYAARMTAAFAFRDGRCCERVFESILAARRDPTRTVRSSP